MCTNRRGEERMKRLHIHLSLVLATLMVFGTYYISTAPAATMGPVSDPLGVVKVAKGQPITVAYWLVIAGSDASLGIDSRRGIEIAIDDKKTVLGHAIKLIGEDDGCGPEGGVTAATKLAANNDVLVAI